MNNNNKFNNIGCSYSPLTNGIAKGMETRITSTPLSSVSVRQQKYNVSPSKISGFFTPTRFSMPDVRLNDKASNPSISMLPVGPLLASTRYNTNISTYMDCKSPGLTSRIVQYSNESNEERRPLTHQAKYGSPNSFPIVHLFKSEIPVISPRPKKVIVKMANPDTSYTPYEQNRILSESITQELNNSKKHDNSDISTRSVLDALKEISRKRIHVNSEYDISDDSVNKRQKTDLTNGNVDYNKRNRDELSPDHYNDGNLKIKRVCVIDPVMASFSSSKLFKQYIEAGIKRKSIDRNEMEKEEKSTKRLSCNVETQTTEVTTVKEAKKVTVSEIKDTPIIEKQSTEKEVVKEVEPQDTTSSNKVKQSADKLVIFGDDVLETNRKSKLTTLLSVLSGETSEGTLEDTNKSITEGTHQDKELINNSNKPKSILSPINKPRHEKHVSFNLPTSGDGDTATKVDGTTNSNQSPNQSFTTETTVTTSIATPISFGGFSTVTNKEVTPNIPTIPTSSFDDTQKVGGFKYDLNVNANTKTNDTPNVTVNNSIDALNTSNNMFTFVNKSIKPILNEEQSKSANTSFDNKLINQNLVSTTNFTTPTINFGIDTSKSVESTSQSANTTPTMAFGTPTLTMFQTNKRQDNVPVTHTFDSNPNNVTTSTTFGSVFDNSNAPKSSIFGITNTTNSNIVLGGTTTSTTPKPIVSNGITFGVTKASVLGGTTSTSLTTPSMFGAASTSAVTFVTPSTAIPSNLNIGTKFGTATTTLPTLGSSSKIPAFGTPSNFVTSSFQTASNITFGSSSNNAFGNNKPTVTSSSTFGTSANATFGTNSNISFGNPSNNTNSAFGTPSTSTAIVAPSTGTFGAPTNSAFGTPSTTSSSMFGAPTSSSLFGTTATTSASNKVGGFALPTTTSNKTNLFVPSTTTAGNVFGNNNNNISSGGFGSNTTTSQKTGTFGSVTTSSAMFGFGTATTTTPSAFGTNTSTGFGSTFGTTVTTANNFGNNNSNVPTFGGTTSANTFGSGFGITNTTTTASSGFGQTSTPAFTFGAKTNSEFNTGNNTFNANASGANAFGFGTPTTQQTPSFATNNATFGNPQFANSQPSTTTTSTFGAGNTPAFGANSSGFGNTTSGFGTAGAFGNTGANNTFASPSGFNNPSTFGSGNEASGFGKQQTAGFGNNTFQSNTFGNTSFNPPNTQANNNAFQFNATPTTNNTAATGAGVFTFGGSNQTPGNNTKIFAFGGGGGPGGVATGTNNADKSKHGGFNFPVANQTPSFTGGNVTQNQSGFGTPNRFGNNNNGNNGNNNNNNNTGTLFNGPNTQFNVPGGNVVVGGGGTGMFSIGSGSTTPRPRHQLKAKRRTQI